MYQEKLDAYRALATAGHWPGREDWFEPRDRPPRRPYWARGPPPLTERQAELYGLVRYAADDDDGADDDGADDDGADDGDPSGAGGMAEGKIRAAGGPGADRGWEGSADGDEMTGDDSDGSGDGVDGLGGWSSHSLEQSRHGRTRGRCPPLLSRAGGRRYHRAAAGAAGAAASAAAAFAAAPAPAPARGRRPVLGFIPVEIAAGAVCAAVRVLLAGRLTARSPRGDGGAGYRRQPAGRGRQAPSAAAMTPAISFVHRLRSTEVRAMWTFVSPRQCGGVRTGLGCDRIFIAA